MRSRTPLIYQICFVFRNRGIVQATSFALHLELTGLRNWPSYLVRRSSRLTTLPVTAASPSNPPRTSEGHEQGVRYYFVFTPRSTGGATARPISAGTIISCSVGTMRINFVTEFLFCRFVVYRKSINTTVWPGKQRKRLISAIFKFSHSWKLRFPAMNWHIIRFPPLA